MTDKTYDNLPERTVDRVAGRIHHDYLAAVLYRSSHRVDECHNLSTLLDWCEKISQGELPDEEKAVADELVGVAIEFETQRCRLGKALVSDLIRESMAKPLLTPSPIPDTNKDLEQRTLETIKQQLLQGGFDGNVAALAKLVKEEARSALFSEAERATKRAERKVRDLLVEGNFADVADQVVRDVVFMPFGVLKGPFWAEEVIPGWDGNTFGLRRKLQMQFERVNPRDFLWSPGATSVANAAYVIQRRWMSRQALIEHPNTFKADLIDALGGLEGNVDWLGMHPGREPTPMGTAAAQQLAVIEYHGAFSGKELREMGLAADGVMDHQLRECVALMLNARLIHLRLTQWGSPIERPFSVMSWERVNDSLCGIGVAQRCARVAKAARAFLYAAVRNASVAAMPIGEVDVSRIAEYVDRDDFGELPLGTVVPVTPDMSGGSGGAAYRFTMVPANTPSFLNAMNEFRALLDEASGIPAMTGGSMQGTATVGRSFRGMALLHASASKSLREAVTNIDRGFEAMFQRMYWYLQGTADATIKADAYIQARGSAEYLSKAADLEASRESLVQALPMLANGLVPKEMIIELVKAAFSGLVDVDRYFPNADVTAAANANSTTPDAMPGQATSPGFGGAQTPV